MFMSVVVSSFQCKYQVLISFLVVVIHFNYLLHYLHRAMQVEIYSGMMVIRLVCFHLYSFFHRHESIRSCLLILDSIETKTYNYFEFTVTSDVSQHQSSVITSYIFIYVSRIHWLSMLLSPTIKVYRWHWIQWKCLDWIELLLMSVSMVKPFQIFSIIFLIMYVFDTACSTKYISIIYSFTT